MTGRDVVIRFNSATDGAYAGLMLNPVTFAALQNLQDHFSMATNETVQQLVQDFQNSRADTSKIVPLLDPVIIASPTNNQLDISVTSTQLPNYKQIVLIDDFVWTIGGKTKRNVQSAREELYQELGSIYSDGTYRYPTYYFQSGVIQIRPQNITLTSVSAWYISEPIYINLNDNTVPITYNSMMIDLIIDAAAKYAFKATKEFQSEALEQQIITQNS